MQELEIYKYLRESIDISPNSLNAANIGELEIYFNLPKAIHPTNQEPSILTRSYLNAFYILRAKYYEAQNIICILQSRITTIFEIAQIKLASSEQRIIHFKFTHIIKTLNREFVDLFDKRMIRFQRSSLNRGDFSMLEKYFEKNRTPSSAIKKHLANKCGLTLSQVSNWFAVHRYRSKGKTNTSE